MLFTMRVLFFFYVTTSNSCVFRTNENKVSSDRGYHSDGDIESAIREPHQHCSNNQKSCYCKIKYYDHSNHFQSHYKRLNPVTPHHDTDAVSFFTLNFYINCVFVFVCVCLGRG